MYISTIATTGNTRLDRPPRWRRWFLLALLATLLGGGGYYLFSEWNIRARMRDCDAIIQEVALRHRVPPALIKAVIRQESKFQPRVIGSKGEIGLMQITDPVVTDWERVTGHRTPSRGMRFDPRLNIEIGTWCLARGLTRWASHPEAEVLALAQYNAGPVNARKWAAAAAQDTPILDVISFPSTRLYIIHVMKFRKNYENGDTFPWPTKNIH